MNYLEKSISFGIENEKCAIPFYQTTVPQREILLYYINSCPSARKLLPIQWRVEVADQCNGWFPAVAVHYRARDHSFRIIVLDSKDPTRECYNGFVPYDYRVIRLHQCQDSHSLALFNQFIRDSVLPVCWEIDWMESSSFSSFSSSSSSSTSDDDADHSNTALSTFSAPSFPQRWIRSVAFFFIRANNLLVTQSLPTTVTPSEEEVEEGKENTNKNNATVLVLLPLVNNKQQQIELHFCHSSNTGGSDTFSSSEEEREMDIVSREEFQRLIFEEHCPASWKARNQFLNNSTKDKNHKKKKNSNNRSSGHDDNNNDNNHNNNNNNNNNNNQSSTSNECVICFHGEVSDLAFIPCGHQVICEDCSLQFLPPSSSSSSSSPSLTNNCPICRCKIQSVLKIYRC
jgi:hypothetical protein